MAGAGGDRTAMSAASIFDVSGVRAIVTGAGSGLGYAMAEVLAYNGARVTLSTSTMACSTLPWRRSPRAGAP